MRAKTPATVRRFKYVGTGQGVPGLPNELSDVEAEQLGVSDLLRAAIDNGNYQEVRDGGNTSIQ